MASHTGSLAGGEKIWRAFFKQTGAVQVGSLEEMAEVSLALHHLPPVKGRGVAILTGELSDVEAAAEIAGRCLAGRNVTLCHSIVSNVHEQLAARLEESTRFFGRK